jgi:hypothetical protein
MDALKSYRTSINLRMLRDAEGALDARGMGFVERERDGHGHGTKKLASLYLSSVNTFK